MTQFFDVTLRLLEGFKENCFLFGMTLLMALPLGLIISFGSMSKFLPLKLLCRAFVWIIRGTPLILQLFVVFYIPPMLTNGDFSIDDRMTASLVAFVINYSCYFSEIFRGGIQSIPTGQYEAGQVLGLTKHQIFFKIILLQVIKRIIPPISNEVITLVKDTSLANVISVAEIIFTGNSFSKSNGLIWPLFYTGVFYLLFSGVLTMAFSFIEKKLSFFK